MKYLKLSNLKTFFALSICMVLVNCERDVSDDAVEAGFSTLGDIFIDNPVGMGPDFFFPYGDSNFEATSFTSPNAFSGSAAIEINVPNADNPNGNYAGGIFRIDGAGRDLTGYDALTFYARASQGVTMDGIGFGEDFTDNTYQTTLTNVSLDTGWSKYVVPIPDPSKLTEERGMLRFAAGTQNTGGSGYTIWIDEVKFENLGSIAQAQPRILGGLDMEQIGFINVPVALSGFTQTFSTPSNGNVTVETTAAFFDFESSDTSVATVDENGVVSVIGAGTATITGRINGVLADGSLTLNVAGPFDFAPAPPDRNPSDVISIFSDAYNNVPVDYYNGFFFDGYQTTLGGAPPLDVNGDAIINYTQLNFVGIGTFFDVAPVNISNMTHLHIDIKPNEAIEGGDFMRIQLLNDVGGNESSGSVTYDSSNFEQDEWTSLDIPIANFGMGDVSKIGLLFFISDATISDVFVDNIYYYREE